MTKEQMEMELARLKARRELESTNYQNSDVADVMLEDLDTEIALLEEKIYPYVPPSDNDGYDYTLGSQLHDCSEGISPIRKVATQMRTQISEMYDARIARLQEEIASIKRLLADAMCLVDDGNMEKLEDVDTLSEKLHDLQNGVELEDQD